MTSRELEYQALRDTIRERGSMRVWIVVVGIIAWAGLAWGTLAVTPWPLVTVLPLLVLAAAFESVFALHTGVERIGRYLQVFHDDEGTRWEKSAMDFGRRFPGSGPDPLFGAVFAAAALFNYVAVVIVGPEAVEYIVLGVIHLLFLVRLAVARKKAAGQRQLDLDRFQQLKQS